jgi:4-oxalomesaconate tautomerase
MPGSVASRYASVPPGTPKTISVEHPSGEFSVILAMNAANPTEVLNAALLRTARLIMRGEVFVPQALDRKR